MFKGLKQVGGKKQILIFKKEKKKENRVIINKFIYKKLKK